MRSSTLVWDVVVKRQKPFNGARLGVRRYIRCGASVGWAVPSVRPIGASNVEP